MRDLLAFCETERAWVVETTEALVRLESPTTDKRAVDRCGAEVAARLAALGGRVERIARAEVGDLIRATFGDTGPRLLLLGHLDTVWPVGTVAEMPVRVADGRLYGPGVFDMKAGIALGMLAIRAFAAAPGGPGARVVMLLTTDEETGSAASRAVVEDDARQSEAVLVLEPALPGGAVKTRRKGCGEFVLTVHGVAAHAGIEPEKGASAIHELARQIVTIEGWRDPARGVSINVGLVRGGTRVNVVAPWAEARVDVRVDRAEDAARLDSAFRNLRPQTAGTRLEVAGGIDRPPLERTPAVVRLYETARGVAEALGRTLGEGATGGGSDGNFTAALGVPTLDGLGAVGDGAHARHEHVLVDELPWRAALVAGLLRRLSEPRADK
jgi:glutamate carboxypeptidase